MKHLRKNLFVSLLVLVLMACAKEEDEGISPDDPNFTPDLEKL